MFFSHIAFEQLVTSLSIKDRSVLVKFFYNNCDWALAILKKFRSIKGMEKKAVVRCLPKLRRKEIKNKQTWSAWRIPRFLNMPVSRVYEISPNILHRYPYKISHIQELLSTDLPVRHDFVTEFLARMEVGNE